MEPMLTECRNCSSIWSPGTEEYEWQQCDACGWQPGDPVDDYDEHDFDDWPFDDPEDKDIDEANDGANL